MDQFLFDCYYMILYQWVKVQLSSNVQETCDTWDKTLRKDDEHYQIRISFYYNGIIEEHIQEVKTQRTIYYIHFKLIHFHRAVGMLKAFFAFYHRLYQDEKKILICCSCGMTSSFFADGFRRFLNQNHISLSVEAGNIATKKEKFHSYDLILLTPQIAYYEAKLTQNKSLQLMSIPIVDYATNNYAHVLSMVEKKLKKT